MRKLAGQRVVTWFRAGRSRQKIGWLGKLLICPVGMSVLERYVRVRPGGFDSHVESQRNKQRPHAIETIARNPPVFRTVWHAMKRNGRPSLAFVMRGS